MFWVDGIISYQTINGQVEESLSYQLSNSLIDERLRNQHICWLSQQEL